MMKKNAFVLMSGFTLPARLTIFFAIDDVALLIADTVPFNSVNGSRDRRELLIMRTF